MDLSLFHKIIGMIINRLQETSITNPSYITSCRTGDDFELCVVKFAQDVLRDIGENAIIHHTPGSHAFPDIIIECKDGLKYGIEVKSSSSAKSRGWKINGNSVMGSTRIPNVTETYIIFGKTAKTNLAFKARKYEDCIANVIVTHSPRYSIDMDLPQGKTFFAESGIEYKKIHQAENPIKLITDYFQSQGQQAWWLTDESPPTIRMFSEIPRHEQAELIGYGFAHFPELFSASSTKFKRLAIWLITERSIVAPNLRDFYTAGGQKSIMLNNTLYSNLPQIYLKLLDHRVQFIKSLDETPPEVLATSWGIRNIPNNTTGAKITSWINVASSYIPASHINCEKPNELLNDILTK